MHSSGVVTGSSSNMPGRSMNLVGNKSKSTNVKYGYLSVTSKTITNYLSNLDNRVIKALASDMCKDAAENNTNFNYSKLKRELKSRNLPIDYKGAKKGSRKKTIVEKLLIHVQAECRRMKPLNEDCQQKKISDFCEFLRDPLSEFADGKDTFVRNFAVFMKSVHHPVQHKASQTEPGQQFGITHEAPPYYGDTVSTSYHEPFSKKPSAPPLALA